VLHHVEVAEEDVDRRAVHGEPGAAVDDWSPLAELGDLPRMAERAHAGGIDRRGAAVVQAEVPVAVRALGAGGAGAAQDHGHGAGQRLELLGEPCDGAGQRRSRRGFARCAQATFAGSSTMLSSLSRPETSTIFATALSLFGRTTMSRVPVRPARA
jgi:hypothetical protein